MPCKQAGSDFFADLLGTDFFDQPIGPSNDDLIRLQEAIEPWVLDLFGPGQEPPAVTVANPEWLAVATTAETKRYWLSTPIRHMLIEGTGSLGNNPESRLVNGRRSYYTNDERFILAFICHAKGQDLSRYEIQALLMNPDYNLGNLIRDVPDYFDRLYEMAHQSRPNMHTITRHTAFALDEAARTGVDRVVNGIFIPGRQVTQKALQLDAHRGTHQSVLDSMVALGAIGHERLHRKRSNIRVYEQILPPADAISIMRLHHFNFTRPQ